MAIPAKTGTTAGVLIQQPQVGTARYGLFSAAAQQDMPNHGEIAGVGYEELHCGQGFLWEAANCTPTGTPKTFAACDGFTYGAPFTIAASLQMGAIGHREEEFDRRVRIRLQDNQQYLVEQGFWGGRTTPTVADTLSSSGLTMTDVTPVPGTPVSLERGVALLEDFMAAYSYPGIFHARPGVSPYLTERLLSVPDGKPGGASNKYRSPMGNVWSFGRGYSGNLPGTGTAPPAPGGGIDATAYIVATGPVNLFHTDVYVNPVYRTMDRSQNQIYMLAEQTWAATIDCLIGYVLVNLVAST